jgi:hypothetical protein
MVADILLYRVTSHLVANGPYKTSIFPKLFTPRQRLYFTIHPRNLFRSHNLQDPYRHISKMLRRYVREDVHSINHYLHLRHLTDSRGQNLSKISLCRPLYFSCLYLLWLLRGLYKMVSRIIDSRDKTFYAHAVHYTNTLNRWNPSLPRAPARCVRGRFS